MQSMEEKLKVLEQTSLPRILVYLLKGSASQTDLNNNIDASQSATYRALSLLQKAELSSISLPQGFSRRKDIMLTEKGKKIAEALEQMEELL